MQQHAKSKVDTSREPAKGRVGERASSAQLNYLRQGLDQPGGKLPLFDRLGQEIGYTTIQACIKQGWAEPWFDNPLKRNWLVCRLTPAGRQLLKSRDTG